MKKARDKAVVKGKTELSYYHLHKFDTEYDRLMMMANEECPLSPRSAKEKEGAEEKRERAVAHRTPYGTQGISLPFYQGLRCSL